MSKIFLIIFIWLGILVSTSFALNPKIYTYDPLDKMPIMQQTPEGYAGSTPIEQREPEFRKFLAASVKIRIGPISGSGTIVYYDSLKNLAYVASCGHLWNPGTMSVEEGKKKNLTCEPQKSPKIFKNTDFILIPNFFAFHSLLTCFAHGNEETTANAHKNNSSL